MKIPAQTSNHPSGPVAGMALAAPTFRGVMALLATLATLFSVMGLTSCVGYTSAAGSQTPSTGFLRPSATALSFGNVATGGTSIQSLNITNTGTATVNISQATISGTGVSVVGGNPTGSIAVGQSSTMQIEFAPLSTGPITGSLVVTSNASNSPLTLSITGTGTQGILSMSPSSVSFGNVSVGQSGSQTVRLSNTGTSSVTISAASASGTGYSISGLPAGQVIGAGQNMSFTTTFNPSVSGASTGSVSITSNLSQTPATIGLSGMGTQATITANPSSASFGSVVVGSKNSQSITLTNSGNTTLAFSQVTVSGTGFSVTGLSTSTTIPAGGNATFSVAFAPTTQTTVQGSIVLSTNASPSQLTIPLSGTGASATTQLSSNPTSLSFGTVSVNSSSTLTSVLTNTGNSNVTLSNVTVVGSGLSASGVYIGEVLQPSQSANLTVTFAPQSSGSLSGASVTVTSNASPVAIGVTGTAAQHSVALSWSGSTSSGVTGYYVYRSATSGTGYGRLNSGLPVSATTTNFADTAVQAGQTYYYVVTAVNSSNVESADSNQMQAMVP